MQKNTDIIHAVALAIALATSLTVSGAVLYPQGTAFPLMMYEVNTGSDATKFFTNTYGWNVIQSYGNTTNSLINSYLKMARSNGVFGDVTIPCDGSNPNYTEWSQAQVQSWILGSYTNINIAWWDLPEESRGAASDVQMFHDYRSWVQLYDTPNPRPTYEVDYGNSVSAGIITNIDILAIEAYGPGGWLSSPASHASVRYTVQQSGLASILNAGATLGSNYLAGQKTLLVDFYCATPSAGNPTPSPQQCYHDFWSAIASGAQGVEVFAYWHALHDTPPLTNNLAQYNLAASQISGTELGQVVLFGTQDPLVNFTVTSGPTSTETFTSGGIFWQYPSINVLCKTWSTNAYVIAVNSTSNNVTANITNLPLASGTATVMFESRSVPVSGSGFSDSFQPWGVHVYVMTNSPPPPATGAAFQWDAKPATAGAQDGSGTWGGASTNWLNSTNIAWSDYNGAIFGVNTTTNCVVTLANDVMPSNITFNATSGSYTIAGTNKIWVASTCGLDIIANDSGTISAPIAGGMGVAKDGNGTVTLSGTNTYTGGTTVNAGIVNVNNDQSAVTGGWTIANGSGDVNFNSGSKVVASFLSLGGQASSGNTLTVAGTVTNNGTLNINRRGLLNLNSGAVWNQSGAVTIAPGFLSGYSANLTVNAGASFVYTGAGAINVSPCANAGGSGVLTLAGGTLFTGQGFVNSTATSTGSGNLVISANGTLKLTASIANLYTTAGSANSVTLGTGSGVIDTAGFSTTLGTVISGSGDLTKLGAGTLTLTASNTCNGDIFINGGTLALTGAGSLDSASSLNLAAGATFDVSAFSSYALSGNTALNAAGTASAATIKGAAAGTVNLGSQPVTLTYDGSHPALYLSQGTLVLNGNAFTVNSSSPLVAGVYPVVRQNGGAITTNGVCTVTGTAIGGGTTGSIAVSGTNVNLIVSAAAAFSNLTASPIISYGTPSLILSGKVSGSGPVYPAFGETVTVTINGNQQATTINDATGDFSINYNPSGIPASATPYIITYAYGGNAYLTAASDTSTALTVGKTSPVLSPAASVITYGQTLAASSLTGSTATNANNGAAVTGSFAFVSPSIPPNTGTTNVSVKFTPADLDDYNVVTGIVAVAVNQDAPVLTAPVASAIVYGQTLASSTLSGGAATNANSSASVAGTFAFTNPSLAPNTGVTNVSVTFTPVDATNYHSAAITVAVTTGKDTPLLTLPTASGIIYGQTLASSVLSGGTATNANNGLAVAGTFAFTTPSIAPNVGTTNVSVTFTPADTNGYALATTNVTVQVAQPTPPVVTNGIVSGAGFFGFSFSGPNGQGYHVYSCTNLSLPMSNWQTETDGVFGAGAVNYSESITNRSQKFFRVGSP